MPAWYDRAPGGVIPSPPRILFDNRDGDSNDRPEPNSGSSDSEQTEGNNSQPETIAMTLRGERAAEIIPWVRSLTYGERLRLARFTSQADHDSIVMRHPEFQLHLRQVLQMRLTSMRPAHVMYREREFRLFDDFASGLPVGLAQMSTDIIDAAASGRRRYAGQLVMGLDSWHEARQETHEFVSQHGRNHDIMPELIQSLLNAGRRIFGDRWERSQFEDYPAPLRTSRGSGVLRNHHMQPVQSLATGPADAPSPGTMHAQDAAYWAIMNQFRRTLQEVSLDEMETDLVRRAAWASSHRPVSHNGRRNAISGPSSAGPILAAMRQSPRIQVPGVNDSPYWGVEVREEGSVDQGTGGREVAVDTARESEDGYAAGSEESDGDSTDEESLGGEHNTQGSHSQGVDHNPQSAPSVYDPHNSDTAVGASTVTLETTQGQDLHASGITRHPATRSASERAPWRPMDPQHPMPYSTTDGLPGTHTSSVLAQPAVEDSTQVHGDSVASRPAGSGLPAETSQVPARLLSHAARVSDTLRSISESPPQDMDVDVPGPLTLSRIPSEPAPETSTGSFSDARFGSVASTSTVTSGPNPIPDASESTFNPASEPGSTAASAPSVSRSASESVTGPVRRTVVGESLGNTADPAEVDDRMGSMTDSSSDTIGDNQPSYTQVDDTGDLVTAPQNSSDTEMTTEEDPQNLSPSDTEMTTGDDPQDVSPSDTEMTTADGLQDIPPEAEDENTNVPTIEAMVWEQVIEWEEADRQAALRNGAGDQQGDDGIE